MARRGSSLLATAVVVVLAASCSTPAMGADSEPSLDEAREQLDVASRELDALRTAVRRSNDEVAALDERLRVTTTRLAEVTSELADARHAHAEAGDVERVATAELIATDEALTSALDGWRDQRARLAAKAVHTYKHGSTTPQDLLVRGVTGAGDWHEVALTVETVGRMIADDRQLVDTSVERTREQAELRTQADTARTAALAAARRTAAEADRVERLVEQQRRIVAEVTATRDERATVLAALEADAAARAVLVQQLEEQVARLELAATTVLVPVRVDLDPYGAPPPWATGLPGDGRRWAAAVDATAARHGLDGRLLAALVWTESGFRPDAVSHAGALGLAQLMPGTARGLGVDPRDPLDNLDGGARYLRTQLERFGRVDLALAAYNAGPGRVERAARVPDIVETQLYVVRVLERYERLGG